MRTSSGKSIQNVKYKCQFVILSCVIRNENIKEITLKKWSNTKKKNNNNNKYYIISMVKTSKFIIVIVFVLQFSVFRQYKTITGSLQSLYNYFYRAISFFCLDIEQIFISPLHLKMIRAQDWKNYHLSKWAEIAQVWCFHAQ